MIHKLMNGIWGKGHKLPLKWHKILGVCGISRREFTAFPRGVYVPEKLTPILGGGRAEEERKTRQGKSRLPWKFTAT